MKSSRSPIPQEHSIARKVPVWCWEFLTAQTIMAISHAFQFFLQLSCDLDSAQMVFKGTISFHLTPGPLRSQKGQCDLGFMVFLLPSGHSPSDSLAAASSLPYIWVKWSQDAALAFSRPLFWMSLSTQHACTPSCIH